MWCCSTQSVILCYPYTLRNIFLFSLGQRLDQVVKINWEFVSGYCTRRASDGLADRLKELVLISFQ